MTRPIFARGLGTSPRGPQGLPGVNAVPAKDAVDAYNATLIADGTSATSGELTDFVGAAIGNGSAFVDAVETILTGPGAGPKVGNELVTSVDHVNLHGVVVNADLAATVACRVESFLTRFDTALAGRQVEFYIGSMVGATFTPTYASGLVDAPETGVLSWTATQGSHPDMAVGDVLGVWCSATTQADSVRAAVSGGNPIGDVYWDVTPADRLAVGTPKSTWDGSPHLTVYVASLAATMVTGGLRIVTSDNIGQYTGHTSQWVGKILGATGTSITGGTAASPLSNGYIGQQASILGCTVDNQGVGSSGIVWTGARALSLGATRAQLTAAGFDPNQSYETKILGRTFDLLILDHHYNDRDQTIGTINDTSTATFYGAYNVVIAAKLAETPTQQFAFLTPISAYSPTYESDGVENPQTMGTRTAVLALARKWGIPVLDWTFSLGINEVTDEMYQPDTVHPNQLIHDRAARMLAAFLNTL